MTYTIIELATRKRLDRLCQLGARPRIIAAMLPQLSDTIIRAHWVQAQQRAPSQGGATSRPSSYWSTLRVRLHSSFALNTYLQFEGTQVHFIDAYVRAFEEYRHYFKSDSPENFDWFWGLVQNFINDKVSLIECGVCGIHYVHNPDDLKNNRNCPCHRTYVPAIGSPAAGAGRSTESNKGIVGERETEQAVLPFMLTEHPSSSSPSSAGITADQ